ncbi:MAG: hypothetical protein EOO89_27990 [Pedobacter sp.]|nr:MAG: hypothetical protein EOO89_27990 [Pedobacter sp.]
MTQVSIPIKLISLQGEGFHLLVEIFVFGQFHHAVIDTGASRSVFEKALVSAHPVEMILSEELQANTLFSSAETVLATIPELKIGKLILFNYSTLAIDLSSVTETYAQFGHPAVAAIIGSDILLRYNAVIDYSKMTLKMDRQPGQDF